MRAIVTGSEGFIGSHMVDFLLAKNFEVIGTTKPGMPDRNVSHLLDPPHPDFTFVDMDLRDRTRVEEVIESYQPEFIFHFGAQSMVNPSFEDPVYTFEVNILGTTYIFETIKRLKLPCTVVVACSSASYGETTEEERPIKETNAQRPIHPYGISKMAQEWITKQYALNFGIDVRVLRLFNQTGPRKRGDACSDFAHDIGKIEAGKAEPEIRVGNLDKYRDITGIKDTLQGIWAVTERGRTGETYNLCSGKATCMRDVVNILLGFSTKNIVVNELSEEKLRVADEPIILGDNTKIREECGYEPSQELNDLLRDMFDSWVEYYSKYDE